MGRSHLPGKDKGTSYTQIHSTGCQRGADLVEAMHFRSQVAPICSVDLDTRVEGNENFNEGKLADAGKIPYDDSMLDVVLQITS